MNKFEEFTAANGNIILLNTNRILMCIGVENATCNAVIIMNNKVEYYVKETYIEIFERLQ